MLSILIPIYNWDCIELVTELHQQALGAELDFEILCLDDASSDEYRIRNMQLGSLANVVYEDLPKNIGRARIRNLLAEKAKYGTLLFVDCDMAVTSDSFVSKYVSAINGTGVVVGGIAYDVGKPDNPDNILRWTYGHERESLSSSARSKHPYASFMTGTFAIDSASFAAIKFDESIAHYGHEDTLFGSELRAKGIKVTHINNPLVHKGLESSVNFISKTEQAVRTLADLSKDGKLKDEVKLYKVYRQLKKVYLDELYGRRFHKRKAAWLKNLNSSKPDLKYFDMYRLGYLCTLKQK